MKADMSKARDRIEWRFLLGNNGENGLPCEVDSFDNAVCEFGSIQDPAQRNGERSYLTRKRAQAR